MGLVGNIIASMGLLLVLGYFCALFWFAIFIQDAESFYWLFSTAILRDFMLGSGLVILGGAAMIALDKVRLPKPEKSRAEPGKKYPEYHPVPPDSLHQPVEA